ncbi:DUF881 domain-containing protein, partial [Frankia sp. EI5c]|uniref:DUF881 domain-containing protein n=1 Tax=Frankia sp. EI5c TaxID=683316 RepID=UPI001F5B9D15
MTGRTADQTAAADQAEPGGAAGLGGAVGQAGGRGRPMLWRVSAGVLAAGVSALVAAAVVTAPAGGRAGGAGVVSAAAFAAEDRRRLAEDEERVRAGLDALATAPVSPGVRATPSPTPPTPAAAAPTPADPLLRRAELAAQVGLTAVRGPAVTIELDDAPRESRGRPLPAGVRSPGPNDLVVHQQDVQAVVNALWSGGAEAMAIMGHRVTPRTAVRCVGNTLLLAGRVYSPPFRISAIGDQVALYDALDTDPRVQL